MLISPDMEIKRGITIKKDYCSTNYIIFEEKGRIFIGTDDKPWETLKGDVIIQPCFVNGLARNRAEYNRMTLEEIEECAYNAYMSGAH